MKKLAALLSALVGLAFAPPALGCGDVDLDGNFDAADVLLYRQWLAEASPLSLDGQAQCTVIGPARPCDVLNFVVMARNLTAGLGPAIANVCQDDDQDGLADSADLCPGSPAGATGLGQGCTALDLVLRPEPLIEPPALLLAEGVRLLGSPELLSTPELQSLLAVAQAAALEVANAQQLLRTGNPCAASSTFGSALAALQAERSAVADDLDRVRFELEISVPPWDPTHAGDGHLAVLPLELGLAEIDAAIGATASSASLIAAACSAAGGPITTQARVVGADAGGRTIRLANGIVFGITESTTLGAFSKGQEVVVTGTGFGGLAGPPDSGIADSVTAVDEGSPSDAEAAYLFLRIAPVQGFPPHSTAPLVLHAPEAHQRPTGSLALERGARIAVVGAVNVPSAGSWTRYSAKIYLETIPATTPRGIAEDLEVGDLPAKLPASVPDGLLAQLVFRVRKQGCSGTGLLSLVCGPFQELRTEVHSVRIYARGSVCSAQLTTTAVDLEDNAGLESRSVAVDDMSLNPAAVDGGSGNTFEAQNCALGPLLSFCSLSPPVPVGQDQPYPVYALEDYVPIHTPLGSVGVFATSNARARHGVTAPSGLRWPRVKGQRNGSTYWYTCPAPRVVRDVVDFCPGAMEDSYYRQPFYPNWIFLAKHWLMGRGNFDQNPGHSGIQSFAFDIDTVGFDPNDPHAIRAARAGRVSLMKEWSNTNDFACYAAELSTCDNGNYLYIRHQDGTFATYWHMTQNTIVPGQGDLVLRASEVARAGNTGNSAGPHLHFHVQTTNGVDTSASIRVRFQTLTSTCFIPPDGDVSPSSNDPSVFY